MRDDAKVNWSAFREARNESGAQVCPYCGVKRWYEPEFEDGCCRECSAEFEAEAVEDLAALAGVLG